MAYLVLGLFSAALVLCIISGRSILYALCAGLLLFLMYGRKQGKSWNDLIHFCIRGVKGSRNIFLNFLFIGLLTASWRAAGTIPLIVSACGAVIRPSVFLLLAFVFNSAVSVLTGSSFGTSATMGVITVTMAGAMEVSPVFAGGAALAGAYFGDRMSPVATSAILVSELTRTDIYDNLKRMARTAAVPFTVSCLIHLAMGFLLHHGTGRMDLYSLYAGEFVMSPWCVLPAVLMIVLALRRLNVKIIMGGSIAAAVVTAAVVQHASLWELLRCLWRGYRAADPAIASMINGGGIVSMFRSACILALTTACSGIFRETDLLDGLHGWTARLSKKLTPFGAAFVASAGASAIACNQTLAVIMTHQLCGDLFENKSEAALALEDSAVIVCTYWPWSIAAATPLSSMGVPDSAILGAFFLFLLPLWHFLTDIRKVLHVRYDALGGEASSVA